MSNQANACGASRRHCAQAHGMEQMIHPSGWADFGRYGDGHGE